MAQSRGQIALHFTGFTADEARELHEQLAEIAAGHGYTTKAGKGSGRGSVAELLVAINSGEVATLLLSDEERAALIEWIDDAEPAVEIFDDALVVAALRTVRGALIK